MRVNEGEKLATISVVDRFEEDEIETEDGENVENAGEEQENGDE